MNSMLPFFHQRPPTANGSRPTRSRGLIVGAKLLLAVMGLLTVVPRVNAQAKDPGDSFKESAESFAHAKRLALAGNVNAAESILVARVDAKPRSFEWYRDCARGLTRLTISLGADGSLAAQLAAGARALAYLQEAAGMTSHVGTLTNLYTTMGTLQERYLHDPAAARDSYQRAVTVSNGNKLAASGLDRLDRAEKIQQARSPRKSSGG